MAVTVTLITMLLQVTLALIAILEEAPTTKSRASVYRNSDRWGQNTCPHAFDGDCEPALKRVRAGGTQCCQLTDDPPRCR